MRHPMVGRFGGFIGSMLVLILMFTLVACGQSAPPAADESAEEEAEVGAEEIRGPEGNIEDFWNNFDWEELTPAEQEAWGVLGWNETSWNEETNIPASEEATWDELTEEEQAAATSLGYTQENWDATAPEE